MEIRRIKLKMIFWGDGSTGRESEDTHQRDGILTQTRAATFQTCSIWSPAASMKTLFTLCLRLSPDMLLESLFPLAVSTLT